MSEHQPEPNVPLPQAGLHHLVQIARDLKSENGENPEYDRALVELVASASGYGDEPHREVMRHLVLDEPREFEIRGRIVIDYAMGFSEAEARQWFPGAQWYDPDASHAGNIETECLDSAPKEFWDFVQIKRDVVVDMDVKIHEGEGTWKIRNEVTNVVEL